MSVRRLLWLGPPAVEHDGHPIKLEMYETPILLAYSSLVPQNQIRGYPAALYRLYPGKYRAAAI